LSLFSRLTPPMLLATMVFRMEGYGDILTASALFALLAFLLRLLRAFSLVRRLTAPLLLVGVAGLLRLYASARLSAIHSQVPRLLSAATLFLSLFLVIRLLEILLFEHLLPRRTQRPVPNMLRDILRIALAAAALVGVIKFFFPTVNFSALAVSSLIVGYILGNATQETLGNLIAGLALNSEDSFSIGDWITVQGRTGRITNITWRSTRILTRDLEDIIIPNATLSREIIINHSHPTPELRTRVRVGVSYDAPPNRVRETLLDAVRSIPSIATTPAPSVRVVEYADFAIIYEVLFFIREFERLEETRAALLNLIWYRFKRAGLTIPFPIRDVRSRAITAEEERADVDRRRQAVADLLEQQPLFAPLSMAERAALAARAHHRIFAAGEILLQEGKPGASLFILKSGRLRVETAQSDGTTIELAEFRSGDLFGERSLLTGEPRSATVVAVEDSEVFELDKESFAPILQANPRLAEALGLLLAQRERDREAVMAASAAHAVPAAESSHVHHFVQRILHFFGLAGTHSGSPPPRP